jgi:hypothetical protein
MIHITIAFNGHVEEGRLVGEMVTGYGELEFDWASLLSVVLNSNAKAFRTIFRLKNEANRVQIGDALMRSEMVKFKLEKPYIEALNTLSWCKKIRNQYAHSHWFTSKKTGLSFTDFEAGATENGELLKLSFSPVDLVLLEKQAHYFSYCMQLLFYLREEFAVRRGDKTKHDAKRPKQLPAPPLHNQKKKVPLASTS